MVHLNDNRGIAAFCAATEPFPLLFLAQKDVPIYDRDLFPPLCRHEDDVAVTRLVVGIVDRRHGVSEQVGRS